MEDLISMNSLAACHLGRVLTLPQPSSSSQQLELEALLATLYLRLYDEVTEHEAPAHIWAGP